MTMRGGGRRISASWASANIFDFQTATLVIPGRAKHELWCAIAHLRIHNHDREYGFRARAKGHVPE